MDLFEDLVLWHLTNAPAVFVRPQHSIPSGDIAEWSCPDFVALDFRNRRVLVVEVSTNASPKSLLKKVENRESEWVEPLRRQLLETNAITTDWSFEVCVYVRKESAEKFKRLERGSSGTPVRTVVIEDLGMPWTWQSG